MKVTEDVVADAVARLRRIEGQVGGLIRMIESRRDCSDVVTQISAASKALDQVGFKLLVSGLRECVLGDGEAAEPGATAELERLFLKLA
jgi:DNA-binding FrmR family transcriptional regulator